MCSRLGVFDLRWEKIDEFRSLQGLVIVAFQEGDIGVRYQSLDGRTSTVPSL